MNMFVNVGTRLPPFPPLKWKNPYFISDCSRTAGSPALANYWQLQAIHGVLYTQSTIDSEGFKGGTRGAPIMPRDAVSRTANVERTGPA